MDDLDEGKKKDDAGIVHDITNGGRIAVVEFKASKSAVLEKEGKIRIGIKRYGKLDCAIPFRWVKWQVCHRCDRCVTGVPGVHRCLYWAHKCTLLIIDNEHVCVCDEIYW